MRLWKAFIVCYDCIRKLNSRADPLEKEAKSITVPDCEHATILEQPFLFHQHIQATVGLKEPRGNIHEHVSNT